MLKMMKKKLLYTISKKIVLVVILISITEIWVFGHLFMLPVLRALLTDIWTNISNTIESINELNGLNNWLVQLFNDSDSLNKFEKSKLEHFKIILPKEQYLAIYFIYYNFVKPVLVIIIPLYGYITNFIYYYIFKNIMMFIDIIYYLIKFIISLIILLQYYLWCLLVWLSKKWYVMKISIFLSDFEVGIKLKTILCNIDSAIVSTINTTSLELALFFYKLYSTNTLWFIYYFIFFNFTLHLLAVFFLYKLIRLSMSAILGQIFSKY